MPLYERCSQPSRSPRTISSSAATGRSGPSAAAAAARSGSPATRRPAGTSRSRSSQREGKPGARAEREVDAATRLRHPRCLRALALARDERPRLRRLPLRRRAARCARRSAAGRVDDWSAVEAAAQVLEALAHAHSKGVVHRDVKPANIMLEDGDEVSVRLLDFGLAQLEHADTLTAVGDVPGTLAYIAPERLAGEEATGAADVWAVGVLLWEALAGRHPFWAVSPLETARRVERGAPPLAQLRPDLPRGALPRGRPDALARPAQAPLRQAGARPAPGGRGATEASAGARRRRRPSCASARHTRRSPPSSPPEARFLLPFFPTGWPFLLGALAALAALAQPDPPGSRSRSPSRSSRSATSHSASLSPTSPSPSPGCSSSRGTPARACSSSPGPILALVHALPLVPLVALRARGPVRRAALGVAAVPPPLADRGRRRPARPADRRGARPGRVGGVERSRAAADGLSRRDGRGAQPPDAGRRDRRRSPRRPDGRPGARATASGASPAWGAALPGGASPRARGDRRRTGGGGLGRPRRLARDGRCLRIRCSGARR